MIRKNILLIFLIAVLGACTRYDDAPVWDKLKDHKDRIARLEEMCQEMNENISSMRAVLEGLQNNDYVTDITKIVEDGVEVGYILSFSKSGQVTIYHGMDGKDGADGEDGAPGADGTDGEDGHNPVIGVQKGDDGKYYWTLDGEWLTDEDGNKIR